jgi:hypothetical protein
MRVVGVLACCLWTLSVYTHTLSGCCPQNENGTIDFPEFLEMAKVLVGSRTNFFDSLLWKYGSSEWSGRSAGEGPCCHWSHQQHCDFWETMPEARRVVQQGRAQVTHAAITVLLDGSHIDILLKWLSALWLAYGVL